MTPANMPQAGQIRCLEKLQVQKSRCYGAWAWWGVLNVLLVHLWQQFKCVKALPLLPTPLTFSRQAMCLRMEAWHFHRHRATETAGCGGWRLQQMDIL